MLYGCIILGCPISADSEGNGASREDWLDPVRTECFRQKPPGPSGKVRYLPKPLGMIPDVNNQDDTCIYIYTYIYVYIYMYLLYIYVYIYVYIYMYLSTLDP